MKDKNLIVCELQIFATHECLMKMTSHWVMENLTYFVRFVDITLTFSPNNSQMTVRNNKDILKKFGVLGKFSKFLNS